tara:strand:- start:43726 stop:44280 length:555 start_codon:yes stop_codon:yes gene_type:complete
MTSAPSELEKMTAGQWYSCLDPELDTMRARAHDAVYEHSLLSPDDRGDIAPKLRALFASCAEDARIETRFHCAYGVNITLGHGVFINVGCTILDTALVSIGDHSMLGPNVQIYCAQHHKDPELRKQHLEIGLPVTIGKNVWIGGGAIILPGVCIGDDAIVGAGSVVTKDVAPGVTVVGNPARLI